MAGTLTVLKKNRMQPADLEKANHLKGLMKRVAEGRDREAFAELFDHFMPMLRAYSLSQQPGAELVADELAQEVMIRVWEKAHTYKPDMAAVSTWVFTMARNYRIDMIRKNARFVDDVDPSRLWDEVEDDDAEPFRALQEKRAQEKVRSGLKILPVEQMQVLAKVYMEGKTHQEASEELDLPLGTVKSRVRLALRKMEVALRGSV